MTELRFTKDHIYKNLSGAPDEDNPQYDHVRPAHDDNGDYWVVDCWLVDWEGNVHPGYCISPVPVLVSDIGPQVD